MERIETLSWKAITRVIIAAVIVYLVVRLLEVILIVVVAMMLAAAFYPFVMRLQRKMPPAAAAVIVFLALFMPIILLALMVLPSLISQFPDILKTLDKTLSGSELLPPVLRNVDLTQYAQNLANYLLQSTSAVAAFVTTLFTIIFLSLYFLIDYRRLHSIVLVITPSGYREKLRELTIELSRINGQYIRGNLLISLICGVIIFAGLFVLSVPYAASLALFAAITDLLPLIGGLIGIIPAAIIGFSVSPAVGIAVIALFIIYQQLENNILAPSIYREALDISPALSFLAVIVGATLFGMVGAFISLPIAASIPTLVRYAKRK